MVSIYRGHEVMSEFNYNDDLRIRYTDEIGLPEGLEDITREIQEIRTRVSDDNPIMFYGDICNNEYQYWDQYLPSVCSRVYTGGNSWQRDENGVSISDRLYYANIIDLPNLVIEDIIPQYQREGRGDLIIDAVNRLALPIIDALEDDEEYGQLRSYFIGNLAFQLLENIPPINYTTMEGYIRDIPRSSAYGIYSVFLVEDEEGNTNNEPLNALEELLSDYEWTVEQNNGFPDDMRFNIARLQSLGSVNEILAVLIFNTASANECLQNARQYYRTGSNFIWHERVDRARDYYYRQHPGVRFYTIEDSIPRNSGFDRYLDRLNQSISEINRIIRARDN